MDVSAGKLQKTQELHLRHYGPYYVSMLNVQAHDSTGRKRLSTHDSNGRLAREKVSTLGKEHDSMAYVCKVSYSVKMELMLSSLRSVNITVLICSQP